MATSTEEKLEGSKAEVPRIVDPEIAEGKVFAAIGYASFLCLIPLYLKRNNRFAQFHGRQALVLFIFELAAAILTVVPVIGDVVFRLACLVFGIFSLAGAVKALMNQYWEMPVIHRVVSKLTL